MSKHVTEQNRAPMVIRKSEARWLCHSHTWACHQFCSVTAQTLSWAPRGEGSGRTRRLGSGATVLFSSACPEASSHLRSPAWGFSAREQAGSRGWLLPLKPTIPLPVKSEFGNLDPQLFQFTIPLLSLEEAGTAWPLIRVRPGRKTKGPGPPPAGREDGSGLLCLHHLPAVEGGVGDDGDVRGELAPDPAEKTEKPSWGPRWILRIWPELPTIVRESARGLVGGPYGKRGGATGNSETRPSDHWLSLQCGVCFQIRPLKAACPHCYPHPAWMKPTLSCRWLVHWL